MDCPTCEAMVDAYVDGELSAQESVEFERALESCPQCRRRLEEARAVSRLLRELPVERAPDLLRARIERELRAISGQAAPRRARTTPHWMKPAALAASLLVAVSIGWVGGTFTGRENAGSAVGDEQLVATYLRVASSDHPVDVASTDRHTVKPWFAGRIDYSPPVHDLTSAGFPLEGGRVDVVAGRKVSVLVYRHNQHRLALSLWPDAGPDTAPKVVEHAGFALAEWRHGGFALHAVSDVAPDEMASFAQALDRATGEER
ncbi:MAG TPA: anti-sigma factor [Reyranella sp.]|jgi:anti-sigma factor RsiW|nr:anti-sigma factor [Reyranella sp.]